MPDYGGEWRARRRGVDATDREWWERESKEREGQHADAWKELEVRLPELAGFGFTRHR